MLLTRRELVTLKKEVIVPKLAEEKKTEERDETLWRFHHPDSTASSPINCEFDYNDYHVVFENGVALIPQWLVKDFEGMGYIKGRKHGDETFGYTC